MRLRENKNTVLWNKATIAQCHAAGPQGAREVNQHGPKGPPEALRTTQHGPGGSQEGARPTPRVKTLTNRGYPKPQTLLLTNRGPLKLRVPERIKSPNIIKACASYGSLRRLGHNVIRISIVALKFHLGFTQSDANNKSLVSPRLCS